MVNKSYNNMGCFSKQECEKYFGFIWKILDLKKKGWGWDWSLESYTFYDSKRITIRTRVINNYPWQVKQEFLHEVAHALISSDLSPHGKEWAEKWGSLIQKYLS